MSAAVASVGATTSVELTTTMVEPTTTTTEVTTVLPATSTTAVIVESTTPISAPMTNDAVSEQGAVVQQPSMFTCDYFQEVKFN